MHRSGPKRVHLELELELELGLELELELVRSAGKAGGIQSLRSQAGH